jgi:tetratricopeptide (TPR) repeat protein
MVVFELLSGRGIVAQLPALPDFGLSPVTVKELVTHENIRTRKNPSPANLGNLGMVYHANDFYTEASKCYELAVLKDSKEWMYDYYHGILNNELGKPEKALRCFKEVIKKDSSLLMAWYYCADAYFNISKTDSAEQILLKISGLPGASSEDPEKNRELAYPLETYATYQLARIYLLTARTDQAEKVLKEIVDRHKAFGPAYRQLEVLYAGRGDSALARHFASRANDLVFSYTTPYDSLVDKLALLSRSETYLMRFIDIAIRSNNLSRAITLLDHGLKYDPDNGEYVSRMVQYSLKVGLVPKALPLLDRNLKYISNNIGELKEVGFLLSNSGLQDKALNYFKQAARLTNEKPEVFADIAVWLYNHGAMAESEILIDTLRVLYPGDPVIPSIASAMYLDAGEKEKAVHYLNELKRISPGGPKTLSVMGLFAEKEGKAAMAKKYFEQSYLLNPKDRFLLNKLFGIYRFENNHKKALRVLEDAVILYPNNSEFQTKIGEFLINCPDTLLRDYEKGREYLERAYYNITFTIPSHILTGKNLSLAYQRLGNHEKSLHYIHETITYAKLADAPLDLLTDLYNQAKNISTAR